MLCGFPSPLHPGQWVDGGSQRRPLPGERRPGYLNLPTTGSLWGSAKASQWYAVYALAGATDTIFTLKAMPVLRVASQSGQTISLRNTANTAGIGYGFAAGELAGGQHPGAQRRLPGAGPGHHRQQQR